MKKEEFEKRLLNRLGNVSVDEKEKLIEYYNELYLDKIEAGEKEEDIISSFGDIDKIAEKVDIQNKGLIFKNINKIKEKTNSILKNKTFLKIYLSLFFITIPLTIAFSAIAFAVLMASFAIILSAYVATAACIISGFAGIVYSIIYFCNSFASGIAMLGCSLATLAIGLLFLVLVKHINKFLVKILFKKQNNKKCKKINTKVLCVFICLFLISGGVCFSIGAGTVGWELNRLDTTEYVKMNYDTLDQNLSSINIELNSRDLILKKAENNNFKIDYYETKNSKITIDYENGVLTAKEDYKFNFLSNNLFSVFNQDKFKVYIYLPEVLNENCKISMNSGNLELSDINFSKDLTLNLKSGNVKTNNINAEKLNMKLTSGNTNIKNSNFENVKIECKSGNVEAENIFAAKVFVKVTSGNIIIDKISSSNAEFEATSGNIKAKFLGLKSDYTITTSVKSGSCNVQSGGAGASIIKASANSGNIHLYFN